jgi:hypothetical protein
MSKETYHELIRLRKSEEKFLLYLIDGASYNKIYLRPIFESLHIPNNRLIYLLYKFSGKGWYEWGVSPMAGWITKEGIEYLNDQNNEY